MNHLLNFKMRLIYFLLIGLAYECGLFYLDTIKSRNAQLIILILFLLYYLFDISTFNSYRVNLKKIMISTFINFWEFLILYWMRRDVKIIFFFLAFTLIQIFFKYLLSFFNKENIRVLILGYDTPISKIINALNKKNNKYEYVGYVREEKEELDNYLGKVSDIEEIVKKYQIHQIIFTSRKQVKIYADTIVELKLSGIAVSDYLGFLEKEEGKVDVDKIDSLWVLMTDGFTSFNNGLQRRIKRAFSLPIMLISAIIIKLESTGPIIYSQARVGECQKEFYVHKFRSMRNDAEKNGAKWAVENDPRVTKYGNFMRKTRIDELPQIWNVLKGEMSFIGPRPERQVFINEIEKEVPNYNLRHFIKPGLTGWAQVMYPYGASIEDAKRKLEYDLYYVKHQDIFLDIVIFFRTIQTVIFGKGR